MKHSSVSVTASDFDKLTGSDITERYDVQREKPESKAL